MNFLILFREGSPKIFQCSDSKECVDRTQAPSRGDEAVNSDVSPKGAARDCITCQQYAQDKS